MQCGCVLLQGLLHLLELHPFVLLPGKRPSGVGPRGPSLPACRAAAIGQAGRWPWDGDRAGRDALTSSICRRCWLRSRLLSGGRRWWRRQVLGLNLRSSAFLSLLPWAVMAVGSTSAGLLADSLVSGGLPVATVRKARAAARIKAAPGAPASIWTPLFCTAWNPSLLAALWPSPLASRSAATADGSTRSRFTYS